MGYEVKEFTKENLASFLGTKSVIKLDYFFKYLDHLKCKTIVVEEEYIDRDYLGDYVKYYSRCFLDYPRKCKRLHFFTFQFDQEAFGDYLRCRNASDRKGLKKLQKTYLGFIVVKPLPITKIGRTCLAVFRDARNPRKYTAIRNYEVNLFGVELSVNSLAFQEQDNEVAACATTAVWVASQKTAKLFGSELLSPADITVSSINSDHQGRVFPSDGLQAYQMCQAFRKVGLEVEVLATKGIDQNELKSFIYAYLHYGIPVTIGFYIPKVRGSHAVTIAGFNMRKYRMPIKDEAEFIADSLTKVYVHDDGLGPFARFYLEKNQAALRAEHWDDTSVCPVKIAIAPVYHKIRVPWSLIKHKRIEEVDYFLKCILKILESGTSPSPHCTALFWDLFLTDVKQLKHNALEDKQFASFRSELLTTSFPRFLWRADLYASFGRQTPVRKLSLIFDATALRQDGFNLYAVCLFDEFVFDVLALTKIAGHNVSQFLALLGQQTDQYVTSGAPVHWSSQDEKFHMFKGY